MWVRPRDWIIAYDCAVCSKESAENEENCIAMGSPRSDGGAEMDTIRLRTDSFGTLWSWWICFHTPYCCPSWAMGQIVQTSTYAPIQWVASLWVTTENKSLSYPISVKVMVIFVYDCDNIVLTHILPQRQDCWCTVLPTFLEQNLRPALRMKRQHFLQSSPIILQDNVPAQVTHYVPDLYRRWSWRLLLDPPYSSDLSPCDYNLIPKMKEPIRDIQFRTVPEIMQGVDCSIININRTDAVTEILRPLHR